MGAALVPSLAGPAAIAASPAAAVVREILDGHELYMTSARPI